MLPCSFRLQARHVWNVTSPGVRLGSREGSGLGSRLGLWCSITPGWSREAGGGGGKGQALPWLCGGRDEDPRVPGSSSTWILTIENNNGRTSLVVQWLRLCTPNTGGQSSIPGQGTRSHMRQLKISHAARKIGSMILCAAM